MNLRNTLILLLVFLGLGAFAYFYEIKGGKERTTRAELEERVFPVKADEITEITLIRMDTIVVIQKQEQDWRIQAPVQTPVDDRTWNALLSSLTGEKISRTLESEAEGDLGLYGLARPELRVEARKTTGETLRVALGAENPTRAFRYALAGEKLVLVANPFFTQLNKSLTDLRDKTLLAFEPNDVEKVELAARGSRFVMAREGPERWQLTQPLKDRADEAEITGMLNRLKNSQIKEFVAEAPSELTPYGLAQPQLALQLYLRGGQEKGLLVGRRADGGFFAKDLSRSLVFKVDSTVYAALHKQPFDLRYKRLAEFREEEVVRVRIRDGVNELEVVRDTTLVWQMVVPDTAGVRSYLINDLLYDLSRLRGERLVAEGAAPLRPYGLDPPRLTVDITLKDGKPMAIFFGREEGAQVYTKGEAPRVYLVPKKILEKLRKKPEELKETTS